MYSAVQVGGRRLYDLARAGEEVRRDSRTVRVSRFDLLAWRPPDAEFLVRCSTGTYVRTLCRDLGVRCGSAAHLAALSRTAVGSFRLEQAVTLEKIEALGPGAPLPGLFRLAEAVAHLPALVLGPREAQGVLQGRVPAAAPLPALEPGAAVRLLDESGRLLAVARAGKGRSSVELLRVFHEP
jgi:tRNA pseudouridine55 synthase